MKKIIFLLAVSSAVNCAVAQNFNWAKREGAYAYDFGYAVATDAAGNVYVGGKYEDSANFSGTILPIQGGHDIFVAKYNANGILQWIRTGGGPKGDYAHAVACDGTNYLYVAGEIEGVNDTVIFPGTGITLYPQGDNDIYLSKYDLNGNLLWAKRAGGTGDDKALGISYDNSGNIYICGKFTDTVMFGNTTVYSYGKQDIFLAKYDANGNFLWVRHAGSADNDDARAMKCDASGNIYVCGKDSTGCTFGNGTLPSNGDKDIFLAKYTSSGSLVWVKTAGGSGSDVAWGLNFDNAGKIYVTGEFDTQAGFGNNTVQAAGSADVFVACYDTAGNTQWVRTAGGRLEDRARALGSDGQNIYITGQFGDTATFGSNVLYAADSSDIFVAALSNSGTFLWAVSVGGPVDPFDPNTGLAHGFESGNAICAEPQGNVYVTGSLINGGIFGSFVLTPYDNPDVFITRITSLTGTGDISAGARGVDIYPNPGNGKFRLSVNGLPADSKAEILVFNCQGEEVKKEKFTSVQTTLDLSGMERGIYLAEIKTNQKVIWQKIVLQ